MAETRAFEVVSQEDLRLLLTDREGPALSLYQPTHRVGDASEMEHDSLRLKNLTKEAEERLVGRGVRRAVASEILAPVNNLIGNYEFWRYQLDGLALFSAPDFFRHFKLPFDVEELVVAGNSFHTTPLMPGLTQGHFYILAIAQGSLRLLRATKYGVQNVDLSDTDIPKSLDEAMQYDDFQKGNLQRHPTGSRGAEGGGRVMQAGHGPGTAEMKPEIARYFHAVDQGISKLLAGENAPLVIAAVDYLIPLYRASSRYRNLPDRGVEGNPEGLRDDELHGKAWAIVEPYLNEPIDSARERFGNGMGTGLASCDFDEVLAAAHTNRVDTLLVARGSRRWGTFDLAARASSITESPQTGDVDLIDLATRQTMLHGGKAYVLDAEQMPCEEPLGAVFRF